MSKSLQTAHIQIDHQAIDLAFVFDFIGSPQHGANAVFTGTVRQLNHGKQVDSIDYDCFVPLAESMAKDICQQATSDFDGSVRIVLHHVLGNVKPGVASLVVAVSTAHRVDAYAINRAIVEGIKHQLPVWKKENYTDGDSVWLAGCQLADAL